MKSKILSVTSTLKSQEDITTNIIKLNKALIANFIAENFNSCIDEGESSSELKDRSDKSNYRPVSILSIYSKVYEKLIYNQLIYNQLWQYFKNIQFPSQCRFLKGYSLQQSLSPNRKI